MLLKVRGMAIRKLVFVALSFLMFLVVPPRHGLVAAMEMGLWSDARLLPVSAMYMLGDSSVDCGDNTPLYGLLHRNLSLFPCNGSDATLLPRILAKKMGLPNPTPFYSQNGSIHGILGGLNFGSAEATILGPGSRTYQSLNQQLRQAFETIQLLHLQLGEQTANSFIKSSVFFLSFGKDDFINYFLNNLSGTGFRYGGQDFTHILVRQMTNAVRNLYAANVRKIVCAGVLPLGCAPRMMLEFGGSSDGLRKGCFDEVNMLVSEHNTRLEDNILAINAELHDARIVFCDVYRAIIEFINNPEVYGIKDVKNACCGLGRYGGVGGCLSQEMACLEASAHVWWDLYNPTPTVNSMVADSAWFGVPLPSISRPITVQELVSSA